MIQSIAIIGTVTVAVVCVFAALFMFTGSEDQQNENLRPNRPYRNRAPSPRRNSSAGPSRRRNTSSGPSRLKNTRKNYERIIEVIQSIHERTLECSICTELIMARERAWFCRSCAVGNHLTCVQKWEQVQSLFNHFSCPNCRQIARSPKNTCMCGRSENPNINYSCGSTCQECTMECHPGKCQLDYL